MVGDDADASRTAAGLPVHQQEPPSPADGGVAATRPRRPITEMLLERAREFDRRGIDIDTPAFAIILMHAERRRAGHGPDRHDDAYRNGGFGAVPASSEAIASLPETTATEAAECAVCLESYEEGDRIATMPCSHGFHEGCIRKWLGISRLCPLCRFKLQPEG